LGDFNLDGIVNNADAGAMLDAIKNLTSYKSAHNLTDANLLALGDFNADGAVDVGDVFPMLNALTSGSSAVQGVPEPASCILLMAASIAVFGQRKMRRIAHRRVI